MSIIAERAVRANRSVTKLSLSRLPKNNIPNNTIAPGAISVEIRERGDRKDHLFTLGNFARRRHSNQPLLRVVNSRMIGGWMTGTKAM